MKMLDDYLNLKPTQLSESIYKSMHVENYVWVPMLSQGNLSTLPNQPLKKFENLIMYNLQPLVTISTLSIHPPHLLQIQSMKCTHEKVSSISIN